MLVQAPNNKVAVGTMKDLDAVLALVRIVLNSSTASVNQNTRSRRGQFSFVAPVQVCGATKVSRGPG